MSSWTDEDTRQIWHDVVDVITGQIYATHASADGARREAEQINDDIGYRE